MNSPSPMSRKELLELASLDALGLLEEYDAALFTRSFHQAPESLQQEILDLQAGVVADASLLPSVEPSRALRGAVVSAVLRTAGTQVQLAPLATITPATVQRTNVARESTGGGALAGGGMWRAASFLLIGALLVSIFFNLRFLERIDAISEIVLGVRNDQQFERLVGRDVWMIAGSAGTHRIPMLPANGAPTHCIGFVLIDESYSVPHMLVLGLPKHEDFTITIECSDGSVFSKVLHSSSFSGFARAMMIDIPQLDTAQLASAKIEIRTIDGILMLASA